MSFNYLYVLISAQYVTKALSSNIIYTASQKTNTKYLCDNYVKCNAILVIFFFVMMKNDLCIKLIKHFQPHLIVLSSYVVEWGKFDVITNNK